MDPVSDTAAAPPAAPIPDVHAIVDGWVQDVRSSIGPEVTTEVFNRFLETVPDLKAKLAASL